MMGTKAVSVFVLRAVIIAGLSAVFALSAGAKETVNSATDGIVGVLDARHGGRAVKLNLRQPVSAKQLRYLNVAKIDSPQSSCCVSVGRRASTAQDGSEVRSGMLSRRAREGFFGVLFVNAPNQIERTSPNEVLLSWRATRAVRADATPTSVQVIHCLSSEGLKVRVLNRSDGAELHRYYVPLGMEVEPDCTAALMPPL